jgi:SAM-dependent methyltransferase
MILNVGCGGRKNDKACFLGDVRIDVRRFPSVMVLIDAHSLAFRDSVFDQILCFEVLEHLDSPVRALKEFRRVLKDDGIVVITVPNVWYWRRIVRALFGRYGVLSKTADHKQAWDIHEFRSLAYQAEFRVNEVEWLDWYPKAKLKLGLMDKILRFLPQICFTHVMFKVKAIT